MFGTVLRHVHEWDGATIAGRERGSYQFPPLLSGRRARRGRSFWMENCGWHGIPVTFCERFIVVIDRDTKSLVGRKIVVDISNLPT